MAFINGILYNWSNISVILFGRTVQNIKGISYKKTSAKTPHYGSGREPVGYSVGENKYEAAIKLGLDEVQGIMAALPQGKSITDIQPFNIAVSYETEDGKLISHTLQQCCFMECGADYSQGDADLGVDLPLLIGGIKGL